MRKIVLISCSKSKLPHRAKARELYTGRLFRWGLKYARSLTPDRIFVLSGKYGLVDLEQELEPYNQPLKTMSSAQRKSWADSVINDLRKVMNFKQDEAILLAGKEYREHLEPHFSHCRVPLRGLRIGEQVQFLKEQLSR